ncbi:MAG: class I SAM-dependent methyltransferase [Anaerolineae bacterium]
MTADRTPIGPYDGVLSDDALVDPNNTHALMLRWVGCYLRVLEIGCATGYMTRVLAERHHCQVTGFEINEAAAQFAVPHLSQLVAGDLESPRDRERVVGQFDAIVAGDVLEHLAQPEPVLAWMRTHLAPGGIMVVSLPNVAHWSVRRSLLRGRWQLSDLGIMDRTHLRWYTRHSAEAMLRAAGLTIREHRSIYLFPGRWHGWLAPRVARWARKHPIPNAIDNLIACQHLFLLERG